MNLYPEPLVARVTGVNRHVLAAARRMHLQKGDDWTLENSVTCYLPSGLKKLLAALGLSDAALAWPDAPTATDDRSATPPDVTPDPEKNPVPPAPSAVATRVDAVGAGDSARPLVDLKVTAISRNPSIVHAAATGRPAVLVRVRTNMNFVVGMPIRARAPAPGGTLYFFEGQCPRWKGRY